MSQIDRRNLELRYQEEIPVIMGILGAMIASVVAMVTSIFLISSLAQLYFPVMFFIFSLFCGCAAFIVLKERRAIAEALSIDKTLRKYRKQNIKL